MYILSKINYLFLLLTFFILLVFKGVEAFYPSKWWAMLSINGVSSRV